MKITDKISDIIFGGEPIEDEDIDVEEQEEEEEEEMPIPQPDKARRAPRYTPRNQESNKVVNISTTAQLQVVVVHPVKYSDATHIANNILEKRTVIVNFEGLTEKTEKRRVIDFLAGVAYASNGNMKKISNVAYLLTPYNVELTDEKIKADLESGSFSVGDSDSFDD